MTVLNQPGNPGKPQKQHYEYSHTIRHHSRVPRRVCNPLPLLQMKNVRSLIPLVLVMGDLDLTRLNPLVDPIAVPKIPEPPQTEEQKQWYLNRAAERRAKRAAKKAAQLAKQTKP